MAEEPKYDEDDDSIEALVWRDQQDLKRKAAHAKFKGTTKPELYKEARKIELFIEKVTMQHRWDAVYYCLLLYIEIATKHGLLKGKSDDAIRAQDFSQTIPKRFARAKKGMLGQYAHARDKEAMELERKQREAEAKAARAAAKVTPPPPDQLLSTLSLEQKTAAWDALWFSGQAIPQALIATATPPVMGEIVRDVPDIPPPSYSAVKSGGMSSECSVSMEKLKHLKLKTVLGDGSCAFRSIAQGMHKGRLSPDQEKRKADELRRVVVDLLIQRGGEEMVGTGMTIEQVVLMKDNYSSYQAYCNAMARSEYAGETEFWLLSEALNIKIAIFMKSDDPDDPVGLDHIITYGTAPGSLVCLFWQRGLNSEAGNHYDCLLPDDD